MRHPDDRLHVQQAVTTAVQQRAPLNVEFRINLRDGTQKWVHMTSNFAGEDEWGQIRNGIMLDVTARKWLRPKPTSQRRAGNWLSRARAMGVGLAHSGWT